MAVMAYLVVMACAVLPALAYPCPQQNEVQCADAVKCAWDDTKGMCKNKNSVKQYRARLALESCISEKTQGKFGKNRFCCKKYQLRCDSAKKFCETSEKADSFGKNKFCCEKHNRRCDLVGAAEKKCAIHDTKVACAAAEDCAWNKGRGCKPDGGLSMTKPLNTESPLTSEQLDEAAEEISQVFGVDAEDVTVADDPLGDNQYDVHFEDVTESQGESINATDMSSVLALEAREESSTLGIAILVMLGLVACAMMVCFCIWYMKVHKSSATIL